MTFIKENLKIKRNGMDVNNLLTSFLHIKNLFNF